MDPTPFYGARAEKPPKKADFAMKQTNICRLSGNITRMVQLPATATIEYVPLVVELELERERKLERKRKLER